VQPDQGSLPYGVTTVASPTATRWTQAILLAGAVLMLGYCAFVLTDTMISSTESAANWNDCSLSARPAVLRSRRRQP
jgi:hypothetical protein